MGKSWPKGHFRSSCKNTKKCASSGRKKHDAPKKGISPSLKRAHVPHLCRSRPIRATCGPWCSLLFSDKSDLLRLWPKEHLIGESQHGCASLHMRQGGKDVFSEPLPSRQANDRPVRPLRRLTRTDVLCRPWRKCDVIPVLIAQ